MSPKSDKEAGHLCHKCGKVWAALSCVRHPHTCNQMSVPCPRCSPDSPWAGSGAYWVYVVAGVAIYRDFDAIDGAW